MAVEVYALDQEDYGLLVDRGLEGVTLYMETYHRETYAQVHRRGRKRDYAYRLEAVARAGRAGVRRLSIGRAFGPLPLVGRRLLDGPARPPPPEAVLAERHCPSPSRGCATPRSGSRWSTSPPTGNWSS